MSTLDTLTSRTVSAELNLKRAIAQVNPRSARRSDDVVEINSALEQRVKDLEASLRQEQQQQFNLEEQLEEKNNEVKELQVTLEQAAPVKVFGKIKGGSGRRGEASSWPHFVWELILEQLVNGTPPTSVNANMVSTVRHFSPLTIIKEQPSIWTTRQGRTVLLVVVETLAVYRLAKAKRWDWMHTDHPILEKYTP
jgi:hypothetical protein